MLEAILRRYNFLAIARQVCDTFTGFFLFLEGGGGQLRFSGIDDPEIFIIDLRS